VKQSVPRRSFYDLKQLPPVTVASAYCAMEEDAEPAYNAIRKWMNVRDYRLAGAKRELYLDQMLEIQFPLEAV
jgi:effector-binding domain-containing protein